MAGIDGFGTQWAIHDGQSPGVFTAIAEVTNIDLLDVSVNDIDVTSHDSDEGWMEYIGGLKDAGALAMEINYDPALHADLMDLAGVERQHKITLPAAADSAEETFTGYINGITAVAPSDDKLSGTVSIKVTGKPTVDET